MATNNDSGDTNENNFDSEGGNTAAFTFALMWCNFAVHYLRADTLVGIGLGLYTSTYLLAVEQTTVAYRDYLKLLPEQEE